MIKNETQELKKNHDIIVSAVRDLKNSTEWQFKNHKDIMTEKTNSILAGQNSIDKKIDEQDKQNDDIERKLDAHLLEAATFIGETKSRLTHVEGYLNDRSPTRSFHIPREQSDIENNF